MKREEEIREAINKHFPCTNGGRCYEQSLGASGFELGVQWADQHPKNVWHNASEAPQGEYEIMCQDEFEHVWLTDYRECKDYVNGWADCVANYLIVRWAYIKDLLPKN